MFTPVDRILVDAAIFIAGLLIGGWLGGSERKRLKMELEEAERFMARKRSVGKTARWEDDSGRPR